MFFDIGNEGSISSDDLWLSQEIDVGAVPKNGLKGVVIFNGEYPPGVFLSEFFFGLNFETPYFSD